MRVREIDAVYGYVVERTESSTALRATRRHYPT